MFLFWCIFSALFQDWESYIQTEFAETKSFRSPSFVAASEGIHFVDFFGPCQEDQPFEEPPQCRTSLQPSIREVHHPINCSHGESTAEIQNILAMCTMLENCKGRGQRMPQVQGPLVRCGRPYLCAQASAAQGTTNDACTATLDLEYVESGVTSPIPRVQNQDLHQEGTEVERRKAGIGASRNKRLLIRQRIPLQLHWTKHRPFR